MKADGTLAQFVQMVVSGTEPVGPPPPLPLAQPRPPKQEPVGPPPPVESKQENPLWLRGPGKLVWAEV
jgi:hypothetical protein